jgi:hypothetical protein
MTRRGKRKQSGGTGQLETLRAELEECVELLRPHYPNETDERLHDRAISMRAERYATGRWPTDEEIEAQKTEEGAAAEVTLAKAEERAP